MIISGIGTRRFFVNLFSEFILNKFPKDSKTIIELADCENFLVIKGKTNYNEILDISKVKEEFISKYSKLINKDVFHTIDLIEYNKSIDEPNQIFVEFYNSENPDYSSSQLRMFSDDNTKSYDDDYEVMESMIITNNFPFSISLNKGKLLYYYAKHIMYNIPSTYPTEKIDMIISNKSIEIYSNGERDLTLESAILDVFDFEMSWLSKEIEKVDLCDVILNPLNDFEFLKKKVKDFIII